VRDYTNVVYRSVTGIPEGIRVAPPVGTRGARRVAGNRRPDGNGVRPAGDRRILDRLSDLSRRFPLKSRFETSRLRETLRLPSSAP
jgi:hypothetical protein